MKTATLTVLALFVMVVTAGANPSRPTPISLPIRCELHASKGREGKRRKRGRK